MFIWTWWVSFNLNSDSARCSGCLVKLRTSVEEMSYANHHYYVGYCQMITHVSICVPTFYLSIYLWIDLSISVCIMYIYIYYTYLYIYIQCLRHKSRIFEQCASQKKENSDSSRSSRSPRGHAWKKWRTRLWSSRAALALGGATVWINVGTRNGKIPSKMEAFQTWENHNGFSMPYKFT